MKKLEINYDFIDKIYESEGKYKVKRFINNNKFTDAIIAGFVTKDIILGATGVLSPEQTAVKVTSYVATMSVILLLLESINQRLKENMTGKTQEERAEDELRELAVQLNNLNISVNLDDLKEAIVYHKKYSLRKDGKPGIIRERYIEVPLSENYNNINSDTASIKEEHVMGSRSYVLTLDTPKKQMVYRKAFSV